MFKKIDMFVFWCAMALNVAYLLFTTLFIVTFKIFGINKMTMYMIKNPESIFMCGQILAYFTVFIYTLKNKCFEIKYFLGYLISSIIISKAIEFLSNAFLVDKIKSAKPGELISVLIITAVVSAYIEGYLYQIFKNLSYEKNKEI